MDTSGKFVISYLSVPLMTGIFRLDRDDSINGSKTQSAATTESNTPENTVRLENMGQKVIPNFHIDNNEVVLESKSQFFLDFMFYSST